MSLKGIKLVTFDATNTLLKFRVPPWESYATAAQGHGFGGTGEDLKPRMISNIQAMSKKYPNFGRDTITWINWWRCVVKSTLDGQIPKNTDTDHIANHLIEEFKTTKCWACADGGDRLLCTLKDKKLTIGIISNSDPRLHDILQNISLSKSIDFVLTSYEAGYCKPDERIFKDAIAMCKQKVQPLEALHIGDDVEKDYAGARAAGWHALIVNNNIKTEMLPASRHVFKSLDKLAFAIENDELILS